jgi:predicted O-methyltransferase YrrM
MRELWRKLAKAALIRPDSVFYWLAEEGRLRRNRRYPIEPGRDYTPTRDAEELITRLCGRIDVDMDEKMDLSSEYSRLKSQVESLYGGGNSSRPPSIISLDDAVALYTLVRIIRPRTVVESGVSDGLSSTVLLRALSANNDGHLTSLDFPLVGLPRVYGKSPGWLVPENLRSRWTLVLGRSQRTMTTALPKDASLDFFFHDSEHSHSVVLAELTWAIHRGKPGTICIVDDALASSAISDVQGPTGIPIRPIFITRDGLGAFRI